MENIEYRNSDGVVMKSAIDVKGRRYFRILGLDGRTICVFPIKDSMVEESTVVSHPDAVEEIIPASTLPNQHLMRLEHGTLA